MALGNTSLTIKDTGAVITGQEGTTDRLLIIAPALDGPTNVEIFVPDLAAAEEVFGPLVWEGEYLNPVGGAADGTYSYNELVRLFAECQAAGSNNIWLCRSGGQYASATGNSSIGGSGGISVIAQYPGRLQNSVTASIGVTGGNGVLTIIQPQKYGGTVTFPFTSAMTVQQLIDNVNSSNRVRAVFLSKATGSDGFAAATSVTGSVILAGGTYGTTGPSEDNFQTKYMLYNNLTRQNTGTLAMMQGREFDFILVGGLYFDDRVVTGSASTTTSFGFNLAKHCYNESKEYMTEGVIGLRPLRMVFIENERIYNFINDHWLTGSAGYADQNTGWLNAGYFRVSGFTELDTQTQQTVDYGRFLSVFAGPDVRTSLAKVGAYPTNGASFYAGFVASMPSEYAATRKMLPGTLNVAFRIAPSQIRSLVNGYGWTETGSFAGQCSFVVLHSAPDTGNPEVSLDTTFAVDRRDPLSKLQPGRIVGEAVKRIRKSLRSYLGGPLNTQVEMMINETVRMQLQAMVDAGKLHPSGEGAGFNFQVITDNTLLQSLGQIEIRLELWPSWELAKIVISTTIKKQ